MQIPEPSLRRFLNRIRRLLPCKRGVRRQIMDNVQSGITQYIKEHPDADMEALTGHFGSPEEIAAACIESAGTAEILAALRIRRKITTIVIGAVIAILLSWAIVVTWAAVEVNETRNGSVDVTITSNEAQLIEP